MIVTYSLFNCPPKHIRWMFSQVGVGNAELSAVRGVQFSKILGHGSGGGFSLWPNFKRYSFMVVWENTQCAEDFFSESDYFQTWLEKSESWTTIALHPIKSHGKWSGVNPFPCHDPIPDTPIAVLTRARIRWHKLGVFWRNVPGVYRGMSRFPGLIFANGIGEYPVFQQATISIWKSEQDMKSFAYQDQKHAHIVMRTRKENWYSEELFGRFNVLGYFDHHGGCISNLKTNIEKIFTP